MGPDDPSTLSLAEPVLSRTRRAPCIHWVHVPGAPIVTRLERSRIVLGRSPSCDITLDAPGVSRQHAELFLEGTVCAVADTASKNGVFVNGRPISHATLTRGDVIRLGDALGVFAAEMPLEQTPAIRDLIGSSVVGAGMALALADASPIAMSTLPIIVIGETGVGKERSAEVLHRASGRSGPLHAVNCAAIPENLAEAELFGHRKGAFTGADSAGLGHFRAAHNGTLFLDELQDISPKVQSLLLRIIQDGSICPVGETKAVNVDVRVIAASQCTVEELVTENRLRADLAMRLSGFVLRIPPLRERRLDINELLRHFLRVHSPDPSAPVTVEVRCLEDMLLYAWPGNVRELELFVRRALALLGADRTLSWQMLPEPMRRTVGTRSSPSVIPAANRDEHDVAALREALRACGGNVSRAASNAAISRQRAYRLMAGRSVAEFIAAASEAAANDAPERGDDREQD